jgi:L-ascorbate metabolism protein UlaG (beta-lactamase superfamily)
MTAQTDSFRAESGDVRISPFSGASVQIEYSGVTIHVDPWSRSDYSAALPADLVLITDTPADHLDPDLIRRLRQPDTRVILPTRPEDARAEGVAARLRDVEGGEVMNNGDVMTLGLGENEAVSVIVEAIPMYDLIPGQPFHAKGEGNGYIVTIGGVRIYLAGVTECTDDMKSVENIDIAFVPMNLPNGRMPPTAAADCVKIIRPDVVYPYHYREQPIDVFVEELRDEPIDVRVRDWYPPVDR